MYTYTVLIMGDKMKPVIK